MSSIQFKTPLTAEESSSFGTTFRQLDKENLGVVTGEAVRPILAASGLPGPVLSQVWALVDTNNKGFLNADEFNAALRVIGHLQLYPNLQISPALYESPAAQLPNLNGNIPVASNVTGASDMSSASNIPLPSPNDVAKFSQLFDRTANGASVLSGDKAKDIFLKAHLPNQTLGEIWALCDKNASGSLDKPEFIMAMYLIQLVMSNNPAMNPVPTSLPHQLWSSMTAPPMGVPGSNNPITAPLSANSTGLSLNRQSTLSRVSSGAFTNASSDWSLSYDKKHQFDVIFDSLDKTKKGSLSSQVLVPFFLSSKLNQETLASIWDLADIHNSADFTKVEFAIAMFLIQKKNTGIDLPDVIPNELLQSPALGLYNQIPQQVVNQPAPQGNVIPSRATKPNFQESPQLAQPQMQQNSNNGSLNDLLALNGSFSASPSQQGVPRDEGNNNFTSNGSNQQPQQQAAPHSMKKFTPTSHFGQSIIQEEDEQVQPPVVQQHNVGPAPPAQRNSSVNLPQVPNFASLNIPSPNATGSAAQGLAAGAAIGVAGAAGGLHNSDLYADGNASAQLSKATTDLANLSTQMNSLSKQATITNDKKSRAANELKRVTDMKAAFQSKLSTLRANHEQNVKQTEQMEASLAETNKQNDELKEQLSVLEANYHSVQTNLTNLTAELQQAQQQNNQYKEQIANLNAQTASLKSQLEEKQQSVKQERSVVDVNAKQLELNQVTVAGMQTEINGLEEKLSVYLNKHKELDDYQRTVEQKHAQLESKYQEATNMENDLSARQAELKERNAQIEEQERLYNEHVNQLQNMFDELAQRKEAFEKADEDLKRQNIEYANNVQELSERQMKLAMGVLPEDAHKITTVQNKTISNGTDAPAKNHEDDVSKFVDGTVANSQLGSAIEQKDEEDSKTERTERTESEIFDKDVPTVQSQSETGDANIAHLNQEENMSDRFEGDLNEYGIPSTQSVTSSVTNNAPQSVRDDVELPPTLEEPSANETVSTITAPASHIPGEWSKPSSTSDVADETARDKTQDGSNHAHEIARDIDSETDDSIQESPVIPASGGEEKFKKAVDAVSIPQSRPSAIDEEFPPIQELQVDESDSSDDEEFQDTKENISTPQVGTHNVVQSVPEGNLSTITHNTTSTVDAINTANPSEHTVKDEFDDEFAELEEAKEEVGEDLPEENITTMEPFESIEHSDLDNELHQNNFTNSVTSSNPLPPLPAQNSSVRATSPNTQVSDQVSNDEWDEIFAGFGNSKQAAANGIQEPVAMPNLAKPNPPVNRAIATTPKSLAIEELSGMGFSEQEATKALEKCNWDLEEATNFLLDS